MKIINSNICTINLISIERLILSSMDPTSIITPKSINRLRMFISNSKNNMELIPKNIAIPPEVAIGWLWRPRFVGNESDIGYFTNSEVSIKVIIK